MIQPQLVAGPLSAWPSIPPRPATGWSDQHNFLAFVQQLHKSGYSGGGEVPGVTGMRTNGCKLLLLAHLADSQTLIAPLEQYLSTASSLVAFGLLLAGAKKIYLPARGF